MSCVTGAFLLCVCVSTTLQLGFYLLTTDFFVIWTVFISVLTTICKAIRTTNLLLTGFLFELHFYERLTMSYPDPLPGKRNRIPDPPSFLMSPMKKRPVSSHLTENEKTIATNIYKYVNKTMVSCPYKTEIIKTTAEIIGTSEKTIQRVINEKKNPIPPSAEPSLETRGRPSIINNLDDFTLSAIRRKVHQFFHDQELPTVDKVLRAVNDDEDLSSFKRSTMHKILKKLNFKYTKRSRNSVLLDRPDLIIWRRNYLLRMKDFRREGRKIYYMDETWVNEGHTANYVWIDQDVESSRQAFLNGLSTGVKNPQKGKRLIVVHIGSEDGFLEGGDLIFEAKKTDREGDYHSEMDAHNFEKWFDDILAKVEPGSVIVMDNAPYHSRQLECLPNMGWRKAEIQEWLRVKEIFFKEEETKAHLMAKIDKTKYTKKYFVDQCAAIKNITVLRLPPYHCELNPIELIWAQIKSYVGKNNKSYKMTEVKQLLQESLTKIDATSWKNCIDHVIKEENKMMRLDGLIDEATDTLTPPFIVSVSDDSSSDDES